MLSAQAHGGGLGGLIAAAVVITIFAFTSMAGIRAYRQQRGRSDQEVLESSSGYTPGGIDVDIWKTQPSRSSNDRKPDAEPAGQPTDDDGITSPEDD